MKRRGQGETRTVPIPPELVALLRTHVELPSIAEDGRLFFSGQGGAIQDSHHAMTWREARRRAVAVAQAESPLAGVRTIFGMPPRSSGSTPGCLPLRWRVASVTAWRSCSRFTPTASTARRPWPTHTSKPRSAARSALAHWFTDRTPPWGKIQTLRDTRGTRPRRRTHDPGVCAGQEGSPSGRWRRS